MHSVDRNVVNCCESDGLPSFSITHVTASVTASGGGIPVALQSLAAAQSEAGLRPQVIGHEDSGPVLAGWPPGCPTALPTRRVPGLPWAAGLGAELRSGSPGILHSHGLWSQASLLVPRVARAAGIPYVLSPHGMLDPWALANARWKKWLAARLFEDRHLQKAACLIALCQSEAESIRAYGLKNPIAIIPNGVDLVDDETLKHETLKGERKILLFLGRLHPKKGLVNALRAWAGVRRQGSGVGDQENWQFVIAGWDQGGHEAELKKLCVELGLAFADIPASEWVGESPTLLKSSSVVFVGPAFGETKDQLLRHSSAFILPSFSEGLPMSVLEAWAYNLPVLMTDHCNLPEGFTHHAAIRSGTDTESIAEGIQQLLQSTIPDLQLIGQNGRSLVEQRFTWPQVATQMKEVYCWVLGQGPKPEFVQL